MTVCFFGDGTTNIGAFHESLNIAAVWNLPVVYVCENNLYMEYTPISSVTAVENPAADRAAAYGLDSIIVDGNDADAVYLVALAGSGAGPSCGKAPPSSRPRPTGTTATQERIPANTVPRMRWSRG